VRFEDVTTKIGWSGVTIYLTPSIKSPEDFVIPKDTWQSCKAVVIDEVLEARAV